MSKNLLLSHDVESGPILGIDVSKLTLDACLLLNGKAFRQRVANSNTGFSQLFSLLEKSGAANALLVMEATGSYGLDLALAAFKAGHRVAVINPRRILDFARSSARRNKTDRVDAELIARFAKSQALELWQPLPEAQGRLRDLLRRQDDLETQLHAEQRRLEVAQDGPALVQSLERSVEWLRAELQRLEQSVEEHVNSHPDLGGDIRRLQAIPGFGRKTARLLVAEIPRHFQNARSVAAWLGVVPRRFESGSSVRKGSRIGHAAPCLRHKLYFPAITAMRFDARSKAFAERLRAAGKAKMSIIFAVLHKLVRTAFALLKTGAEYQPDHALQTAP